MKEISERLAVSLAIDKSSKMKAEKKYKDLGIGRILMTMGNIVLVE